MPYFVDLPWRRSPAARLVMGAVFGCAVFTCAVLGVFVPAHAGDAAGRGPAGASPADVSAVTVGPWQVIGRRDAGIGACIARRDLGASGIDRPSAIEFLHARGQQSLRITAEAWSLTRDVAIPVTISAGERVRGRTEARLHSPTQLSIGLGDLLTTLARIGDAPAIEIRVAYRTLTLPLSDVPAMRAAFATCIAGRLRAPGPELAQKRQRLTGR